MNKSDKTAIGVTIGVTAFFCFVPGAFASFRSLSAEHGFLMSFVKFAILATFGECLALRLMTGSYNRPGFGVLPKIFVWGVLGVIIKTAFIVFATGTPQFVAYLGLPVSMTTLAEGTFFLKLVTAFAVSVTMNCIFAPVMMTVHKITDAHIHATGGELRSFFLPMDVAAILRAMDWNVMWNFVFKKTITLFWIPAHTITFMLPPELQTLFAAVLGVMLGVILAFAGNKGSEKVGCAASA